MGKGHLKIKELLLKVQFLSQTNLESLLQWSKHSAIRKLPGDITRQMKNALKLILSSSRLSLFDNGIIPNSYINVGTVYSGQ